jgi:hypothetical protein
MELLEPQLYHVEIPNRVAYESSQLEMSTRPVEGGRPEKERVVTMCTGLNKILMPIHMVTKVSYALLRQHECKRGR